VKGKNAIIVLAAVACALAVGFFVYHRQTVKQTGDHEARIVQLSNDVVQTSVKLSEQQKVNLSLETNIATKLAEIQARTREADQLTNLLTTVTNNLNEARKELEEAQEKIVKRDAKIADLEAEKAALDTKATALKLSIDDLEGRITLTQGKLAKSEGDKEFLLKELKRLQAEKAELERQFNDLAVLRAQVSKLKEELSIARRLEWIRKGLYGTPLKGGERLQAGFKTPTAPAKTNVDLNVEIKSTGGARIVPPTPLPAPAVANPPTPAPITPAPVTPPAPK
jgi:septal ring factor EnvC (AmiA/AmiB activator)